MAVATYGGLVEEWSVLRENPLFRRQVLPRGFRFMLRSPIFRAFFLTLLAVIVFEYVLATVGHLMVVMVSGALFWTLVHSFQHFFCWLELRTLTATGNLQEYLASGMTRADVAMGLIYPAKVADQIAVLMLVGYFLYGLLMGGGSTVVMAVLGVVLVLALKGLFEQPFLFLPDVENYLRKRNPLALYFIVLSQFVPLLIWFTIFYGLLFGSLFVMAVAGMAASGDMAFLVAFVGAYVLAKWPREAFWSWQLKRFYGRYESFEDLFDRYFEGEQERAS